MIAFKVDARDNVATLLGDVEAGGCVLVRGEAAGYEIAVTEAIRTGHKLALTDLDQGEPVVKYGLPIGEMTQAVHGGAWVHLHNCRSCYDAASSKLSVETGERSETRYA